jgi:predicted RNase H-like nuclease (RuvC/YqgF family)
MTDEIELWGEINNDLTDNGSLSTYKVDVYKLTSHLEQLYSKIESLEKEIEDLKWDKIRDLEREIENLNYKLGTYD